MTEPPNDDQVGPPAPPTVIDPGRAVAGVPATIVDPGRGGATPEDSAGPGAGQPEAPVTVIDPGRKAPPRSQEPPSSSLGLPAELAERFKVLSELVSRGRQANVYLVKERESDVTRVLKLYHDRAFRLDQRIETYLKTGRNTRSVVEVFETAVAEDGRYYELMEYLAGDSLEELGRKRTLDELGTKMVASIIKQLVDALDELHANGIVHRDVKPNNIVLRSLDPLEVAIIDLGISSVIDDPDGQKVDDGSGTPPYTPPEFLGAGWVSPGNDWWALGISLIEFFTRRRFLEGLDVDELKKRITSVQVSVAGVTDQRQRLLCQGLTAQAEVDRWGSKQVREWLAGGSPEAPGYREPDPTRPGGAEEPYEFQGGKYRFPDELAAALTTSWEIAATLLYGEDSEPRDRLREWVRQFPDVSRDMPNEGLLGQRGDRPNVRLLRTLRALDPAAPPVYRNENIGFDRLPELAKRAFNDQGNSRAIVQELWDHKDLLKSLAKGRAQPGLSSGDGLDEAQRRWINESKRLQRLVNTLPDEARAWLDESERERPALLTSLALLVAAATVDYRNDARARVDQCLRDMRADEAEVPWFADLAGRRDCLWLAWALIPVATNSAQELVAEATRARIRREWLRRSQAVREWSRRQNRPQALAWSVFSVVALATLWALLIGLGDIVNVVSDATIVDAWMTVAFALPVVLAAEGLLAWELGSDYQRRYSMLTAGQIAFGQGARYMLRRRLAVVAVFGVLGFVSVLAIFVPVAVAPLSAAIVGTWTWLRFTRWQEDRVREQQDIERAERERRAAAA